MVKKIDNMRRIILDFAKQLEIGFESAKYVKAAGQFNKIIICGMGGSSLPGEILKTWLIGSKVKLPVIIHRDYNLPVETDRQDLVVCVSYSGNTFETLSSFKDAVERKLNTVAITSGGKLSELCRKYNAPFAIIPAGAPARTAVGYQTAALLKILINSKVIHDCSKDISTALANLKPKRLENQGQKIAKKLKNKTPIVYSSSQNKSLAYIWKINFNESTKIPAFYNCFPEMNHNELSCFENAKRFHAIMLRDREDDPRIFKRMRISADIMKKEGVGALFINIAGANTFLKIFNNILLSMWASYYLAKEYRTDPIILRLQDEMKKRLGN